MKRAMDVMVSTAGLILAIPLMLAASAAVRLESRGPVIFRQERVGRNGEVFDILKFRTMRIGEPGAQVTVGDDPRITRTGKWLRSSKIDELPQLINVLRGEMSLVGPRPEVPIYVAHWPEHLRPVVLSVRPGITDPASIEYRRETEELANADDPEGHYIDVVLPRKVEIYAHYVRTRSLRGDFRILLSTLRTVVED